MTEHRFGPWNLPVVASSRSEAEEDRLDAIARLRAHRSLWWWLTAPAWERRAMRHALMVLEVRS